MAWVTVQRMKRDGVLGIPDQGVAEEAHVMVTREGGDSVRGVKAERAVVAQDVLHLHLPLGGELRDVADQQVGEGRIVQSLRGNCAANGCRANGLKWGKVRMRLLSARFRAAGRHQQGAGAG